MEGSTVHKGPKCVNVVVVAGFHHRERPRPTNLISSMVIGAARLMAERLSTYQMGSPADRFQHTVLLQGWGKTPERPSKGDLMGIPSKAHVVVDDSINFIARSLSSRCNTPSVRRSWCTCSARGTPVDEVETAASGVDMSATGDMARELTKDSDCDVSEKMLTHAATRNTAAATVVQATSTAASHAGWTTGGVETSLRFCVVGESAMSSVAVSGSGSESVMASVSARLVVRCVDCSIGSDDVCAPLRMAPVLVRTSWNRLSTVSSVSATGSISSRHRSGHASPF